MKEYMKLALESAVEGRKKDEVPVGAVIVKDGIVIASAHNEVEKRGNPLAHAEILAIEKATKFLKDWRLINCTIYVTLEPCLMCMGAILNSRISRLVYGAGDNQKGAVESQIDLMRNPLYKDLEIYGGIYEKESINLLSEFFQNLRK